MKDIQTIILRELIHNKEFSRRVIPFLKKEYFSTGKDIIFDKIFSYTTKYSIPPTLDSLFVELQNDKLNENTIKTIDTIVKDLNKSDSDIDLVWLMNKSEDFCKERAIHLALQKAITIYDEKNNLGEIPDILKDALSVGFDSSIGHDYYEDSIKRYEYFTLPQYKIPFRSEILNKITKGGVSKKTLNLILAGTHGGKSLHMCSMAADNLLDGKNVLYISLEMAEEEISKRIDANLLDVPMIEIEKLSKENFIRKITNLKKKAIGKLIVKEYPTSTANIGHFRVLLNELKLKKDFVPDIVYIDYLNICSSFRLKGNNTANSFTYYKAIAEELRGFAQEQDIPVYTATQLNRGGFSSSDPNMEDISESFGIVFTGDFIYSLSSTDEQKESGTIMIKQLKNRYTDMSMNTRFLMGIDRQKMRMFDLDDPTNLDQKDSPVMDKTEFGQKSNKSFDDFVF